MPELLVPIAQRKKKAGIGKAFGIKMEKCTGVCFCLSLGRKSSLTFRTQVTLNSPALLAAHL